MDTKNIGKLDRYIRFLLAVGFVGWAVFAANYFWLIPAVLLLATVYTGRCLFYSMANMSTTPDLAVRKHKEMRYRPGK
ncbi:MAG: DUF2892 domain-containing protein [bacterium]|nr:DUF2892 domain-containing protein [bacterium]